MIFKGTWEKVLDGTKIQTRRPYKENQLAIGKIDYSEYIYHSFLSFPLTGINQVRIGKTQKDNWEETRLLWEVGRTYAVQPGRGKKSLGRIRLLKIRLEKLHDIKAIDCFKEGIEFPSWAEHIKFNSGKFILEAEEIFALNPYSWNALMFYGIDKFQELWELIYEGTKFAFEKNPDVWALEFELVEKY